MSKILKFSNDVKLSLENVEGLCYTGFRGKDLGTSVTDAQWTAIANGDMSDLWNGDYWVINGIKWRIVDNTNYFYNFGDSAFTKNHIVVMPDSVILGRDGKSAWMNDSDTTTGGYVSTKYRSTHRATCKATFASAFGEAHIATHRELMCNAVSSGQASGWTWQDADTELPTEENMYGTAAFSANSIGNGGSGYNVGVNQRQFALFKNMSRFICNRSDFWLRNVASSSSFAYVHDAGYTNYDGASNPWIGFRPYSVLVKS